MRKLKSTKNIYSRTLSINTSLFADIDLWDLSILLISQTFYLFWHVYSGHLYFAHVFMFLACLCVILPSSHIISLSYLWSVKITLIFINITKYCRVTDLFKTNLHTNFHWAYRRSKQFDQFSLAFIIILYLSQTCFFFLAYLLYIVVKLSQHCYK